MHNQHLLELHPSHLISHNMEDLLGHAHSIDQVHSTDLQILHGSNANNNTE